MGGFGFSNKMVLYCRLINGYVKSGNLESVSRTILGSFSDGTGEASNIGEETYCKMV